MPWFWFFLSKHVFFLFPSGFLDGASCHCCLCLCLVLFVTFFMHVQLFCIYLLPSLLSSLASLVSPLPCFPGIFPLPSPSCFPTCGLTCTTTASSTYPGYKRICVVSLRRVRNMDRSTGSRAAKFVKEEQTIRKIRRIKKYHASVKKPPTKTRCEW